SSAPTTPTASSIAPFEPRSTRPNGRPSTAPRATPSSRQSLARLRSRSSTITGTKCSRFTTPNGQRKCRRSAFLSLFYHESWASYRCLAPDVVDQPQHLREVQLVKALNVPCVLASRQQLSKEQSLWSSHGTKVFAVLRYCPSSMRTHR